MHLACLAVFFVPVFFVVVRSLFKGSARQHEADLRHARLLGSMPEERFEEFIEILVGLQIKNDRRLSTRAVLAILRKYGDGWSS